MRQHAVPADLPITKDVLAIRPPDLDNLMLIHQPDIASFSFS